MRQQTSDTPTKDTGQRNAECARREPRKGLGVGVSHQPSSRASHTSHLGNAANVGGRLDHRGPISADVHGLGLHKTSPLSPNQFAIKWEWRETMKKKRKQRMGERDLLFQFQPVVSQPSPPLSAGLKQTPPLFHSTFLIALPSTFLMPCALPSFQTFPSLVYLAIHGVPRS